MSPYSPFAMLQFNSTVVLIPILCKYFICLSTASKTLSHLLNFIFSSGINVTGAKSITLLSFKYLALKLLR